MTQSENHILLMLLEKLDTLNRNIEAMTAAQRAPKDDDILTAEEAAAIIKVESAETVRAYARRYQIPYSTLGDGPKAPMRFLRKDVIQFATRRNRVGSGAREIA